MTKSQRVILVVLCAVAFIGYCKYRFDKAVDKYVTHPQTRQKP